MSDQRTTALGLWRHAKEFADAASLILNRAGSAVSLPTYYLLGHSIELSLKAFLVGRGLKVAKLRSKAFGHDLRACLEEARRLKLGREVKLTPMEVGVIQLLSFDYAAKRFEYRETGVYHLPLIDVLEQVTHKLVHGLKSSVKKLLVNHVASSTVGRKSAAPSAACDYPERSIYPAVGVLQ
jgi:hypothetical protein